MKFDPIKWCWGDDEITISFELKEAITMSQGEIDAD